jgi:hypothetical protein
VIATSTTWFARNIGAHSVAQIVFGCSIDKNMKDRIIVSVKPAGHCEPIGREILRSNGSRTCIVRLGHVATMNGFVQALYEMHRFATKFDRPMPQKPLFHGHNLNWSGRRESNRRMQLGKLFMPHEFKTGA